MAAQFFRNNAEIIEACVKLQYLHRNMKILDPTFGKGNWWTNWYPERLVAHDLAMDGTDFRNLPYKNNTFGAIAYDPPYVSAGGRESSNIKEMYDAYGLMGAPTSPQKLQKLINAGLREMHRVVRPARLNARSELSGGIVIVKCMDYVSSGQLWSGSFRTEKFARKLGFVVEDKFHHVRKAGGPQPLNRTKKLADGRVVPSRQMHARQNVSMMLVLRKVA